MGSCSACGGNYISGFSLGHFPGTFGKSNYGNRYYGQTYNVQWVLKKLNYSVQLTGYFDDQTVAAVKRFQFHHSLDNDGVVGSLTWDYLNRHCK